MNAIIAGAIGLVLAGVGVVGGVSAYQGAPDGVSQANLYTYADN